MPSASKTAAAAAILGILFSLRAAEISSFQAGSGAWQLGTLAVGDIAGDSAGEIIVPYRDNLGLWNLDAFDWRGNRLAGFPHLGAGDPINVSPTLYDLDGDGKAEILFTRGQNIVALRGNGSTLWTHNVSALNYVPDSGFMAATNGFFMSPTGAFQPLLPPSAQFFSEVSPPIVADLAGNGTLELLTAWKINPDPILRTQDYNPAIRQIFGVTEWGVSGESWSGGVVSVNARTGARTLAYHFHQLVEAGLAVGQADADAAREVYVLNDADSVAAFDRTQPHGFHGKGMLHKMFGKNQRLLSGSYLTGVDVHAADVDGDGRDEVLVASSRIEPNWQPMETMLDDDGAILWRKWIEPTVFATTHGWFNSATMFAINPDRDNKIDVFTFTHSTEIAFRFWNGVEFVDRPGWPKNFAPRLPSPPVVGDIDGDGAEEVIIGAYNPNANPSTGNLHIFSLDGAEERVIPVNGGLKHIPTIADANNDGSIDLIYRGMDGRVYIQNFGASAGARVSWATHRGNARRDGNMNANLFPPGTPLIESKAGGYNHAEFSWRVPGASQPSAYRIYRNGTLVNETQRTNYRDAGAFALGAQAIYEVEAIYPSGGVRSAPFAITFLLNNNLIANGGFEENSESHWDKWFSGDIPWTRMMPSPDSPAGGAKSMEIKLQNDQSQSSITQYSHFGVPESYLKTTPGTLYSFGGYIRAGSISAATEHWFEWDSSKTGEDANPRPGLPWPEYFTPSVTAAANTPTSWNYLNRVFTMPAGFPNAQLRHRIRTTAPATGSVFLDNVFFRPLPAPNDAAWRDWIPFGATWRYNVNTPEANWFAPATSVASWPEAPAKFGAGGGPQNIRTAVTQRKPAYYFRRDFNITSANVEELLLAATCTDDYGGTVHPFKIWLNGTEIPAEVHAVTGEGNIVKYFDLTPFANLLRNGANTIAIMLRNTWVSDWDNVAFDVNLKAIPRAATDAPRIISAARLNDGTIQLQLSGPPNSTWTLESSDTLPSWQTVQNVTLDANGLATVIDSGQGGRSHPANVRSRAYRMRA